MKQKLMSTLNHIVRRLATKVSPDNPLRKALARRWHAVLSKEEVIGIPINDRTFLLSPIYRSMDRKHEPPIWFLIETLCREADHFIDVGANIGVYTILASKVMSPRQRIDSFEPNKSSYDLLVHHIKHNPHTCEPILHNVAIYDGSIDKVLIGDPPGSVADSESQIKFAPDAKSAGQSEVPCIALDNFGAKRDGFLFIKVDVEGAEAGLLRGAKNLIAGCKDLVMILSAHPEGLRDFGETIHTLEQEVSNTGMLVMDLEGKQTSSLSSRIDEYICCTSPERFQKVQKLMQDYCRTKGAWHRVTE